jgi:hypothetical protein
MALCTLLIMTQIITNLRKMRTSLDGVAQYLLPVVDVLEEQNTFYLNPLVGEEICIQFLDEIHCIESGKKIKKTYGEGLCYDRFLVSPLSCPSIIRPELSRIHEGIALRDMEWEQAHHNQPHYVYLSRTSGIKVGVTRSTNLTSRWIDQGATEGIILAETPYRQLAGLIEVALKETIADKTAWQAMLKNEINDTEPLLSKKEAMMGILPMDYEPFFSDNDNSTSIEYPVLSYPKKVKTIKLDTIKYYKGKLLGIKGQYLILENDLVLNVRSHAGYRVSIEF